MVGVVVVEVVVVEVVVVVVLVVVVDVAKTVVTFYANFIIDKTPYKYHIEILFYINLRMKLILSFFMVKLMIYNWIGENMLQYLRCLMHWNSFSFWNLFSSRYDLNFLSINSISLIEFSN